MTETNFAELDALHRAGILTEGEYVGAREKLVARHRFTAVPSVLSEPETRVGSPVLVNAPRHAVPRGRHAKQPRRWPWIAGSVALLAAAVAVGIVLRPAAHPAHTAQPPLSPAPSSAHSSAIVVASPANTPMAINIDGADARVAVSSLVVAPASKLAAGTTSTGAAKATPTTTTYTAMVTVSGTTGTFAIDPDEFTAHSISGRSYPVSAIPLTTLHSTTVGAGQHATGAIAFTVPAGEHIAVVLFTTPLGEQLGLWSTT